MAGGAAVLAGAVRSQHQNVPRQRLKDAFPIFDRFHFSGSRSEQTRWAGRPMKDYRTHPETLRKQAAESALISALATDLQKRELFAQHT